MAFTVTEFKAKTAKAGGTARPSLFEISMGHSKNTALSWTSDETILCKAASIPPANIAPLAVNYHGRAYKWQGFRTFDNWTTTILNDENFSMRNKVMEWMRVISGQLDGERNGDYGSYATAAGTYFEGQATVTQVNKDGEDGQSYTIDNIWPTNLGEIALGWENDAIEEYTVEWCYDTWKSN